MTRSGKEIRAHVGSLVGTLGVALALGALLGLRVGPLRAAAAVAPLALAAGAWDARAILRRRAPAVPAAVDEPDRAEAPLGEAVRAAS